MLKRQLVIQLFFCTDRIQIEPMTMFSLNKRLSGANDANRCSQMERGDWWPSGKSFRHLRAIFFPTPTAGKHNRQTKACNQEKANGRLRLGEDLGLRGHAF